MYFGLAKIESAGQLAHTKDVKATFDDSGMKRRGVSEFWQANSRAQVGKQSEMLAKREQRRPFGLFRGRKGFPFRSADGSEQDGVGLFTRSERFFRQRFAVRVDRRAANGLFVELESNGKLLFHRAEHTQRRAMTSGPMPSPARTAIL